MNIKFFVRVLVTLILPIWMLTGCDLNAAVTAVEDLEIIVKPDSVETYVAGQIMDAATGKTIDSDVVLAFSGPDRGDLIDMFGQSITGITTSEGQTAFGLRNGHTPSVEAPIRFTLEATHPAYEAASTSFTITRKGLHTFALLMNRKGVGMASSSVPE